jgi:hypothetical protein
VERNRAAGIIRVKKKEQLEEYNLGDDYEWNCAS